MQIVTLIQAGQPFFGIEVTLVHALVSLALGFAVCLSLESNQTWAPPRHAGDTEIDLRLFQTPRLTGA